jgi:hypothetical protein
MSLKFINVSTEHSFIGRQIYDTNQLQIALLQGEEINLKCF